MGDSRGSSSAERNRTVNLKTAIELATESLSTQRDGVRKICPLTQQRRLSELSEFPIIHWLSVALRLCGQSKCRF